MMVRARWFWCCLTFELSGRRRQDARPGLAKMYTVLPARAWWPAVGAPLERGVRPHCVAHTRLCLRSDSTPKLAPLVSMWTGVLQHKSAPEGDTAATRRGVLDVHMLNLAPEAGSYGCRERCCLFAPGVFLRPVRVKYPHKDWEIVVFNRCSVLCIVSGRERSHSNPDSSCLGVQYSGNRIRDRLSRVLRQFPRG